MARIRPSPSTHFWLCRSPWRDPWGAALGPRPPGRGAAQGPPALRHRDGDPSTDPDVLSPTPGRAGTPSSNSGCGAMGSPQPHGTHGCSGAGDPQHGREATGPASLPPWQSHSECPAGCAPPQDLAPWHWLGASGGGLGQVGCRAAPIPALRSRGCGRPQGHHEHGVWAADGALEHPEVTAVLEAAHGPTLGGSWAHSRGWGLHVGPLCTCPCACPCTPCHRAPCAHCCRCHHGFRRRARPWPAQPAPVAASADPCQC